jgi:hypothetical protein
MRHTRLAAAAVMGAVALVAGNVFASASALTGQRGDARTGASGHGAVAHVLLISVDGRGPRHPAAGACY